MSRIHCPPLVPPAATARATTLFVVLLVCWAMPEAWAQNTGNLAGQVFDNEWNALPGVTVTVSSQDGSFERLVITNADGEFRLEGLEVRSYTIKTELEGFKTADPFPIFIRGDRPNTIEIQMFLDVEFGEAVVQSVVNGADFLPLLDERRVVPGGGVVAAFGAGLGPEDLIKVDSFPIETNLGGFSADFRRGDESVPCLPLFASDTQSACVASSDLTPGLWTFVGNWLGNPSNGFDLDVDLAQPGVFTFRGNGQGGGIATKLDNSLATFINPLLGGDLAIVWTTGFGENLFDDRPAAKDKRGIYNSVDFSLGGVPIPDGNIIYIGASGCCAGLDQFMAFVPEGVPHGCGVPLTGGVFIEDRYRAINPVSLPIGFRFDDGPCSDAHGLSAEEIEMLQPRLTRGVLAIKSSSSVGEDFRTEFVEFSYTVNRFTNQTYDPLPAGGTCNSEWFPPNPSGAFFPVRLPIAGTVALTLPGEGREIRLNEQSDPLPHFQFFFDAFPELDPGQYQLDFEDDFAVDGVDFTDTWTFNLSRSGALAKEALIDRVPDDDASFANIVNAWSQAGLNDPNLLLIYEADYPGGPRGDHKIECVLPGDFDEEMSASAIAAEQFLRETQLRQGIPIEVFREVTIVPVDRDLRSHDGAPLDFTEQRAEDVIRWSGSQTNP